MMDYNNYNCRNAHGMVVCLDGAAILIFASPLFPSKEKKRHGTWSQKKRLASGEIGAEKYQEIKRR
jgi:hypothetical protein